VANSFHEQVNVTGAIFTKMDGDTRGGAILSVRSATGVPVRYLGVGEQVEALDTFVPARVAERIIGMGDIMGIIEKAEMAFAGEDTNDLENRLKNGQLDFNFMLESFRMMKKMGPLKNIMKMIPGMGAAIPEEALDQINDKDTNRIEAMILSMTPKERSNPDIINGSRRKRIAAGSGTSVEEVNHLIKQFHESRRGMKQLGQMQQRMAKRGGLRRRK
jgi:signal recognition particle subunit SRP54